MAEYKGITVASCPSLYGSSPHVPHEWTFNQDWGPQRSFQYWCWGIKSIETWEADWRG